jgi:hypothetical protein
MHVFRGGGQKGSKKGHFWGILGYFQEGGQNRGFCPKRGIFRVFPDPKPVLDLKNV